MSIKFRNWGHSVLLAHTPFLYNFFPGPLESSPVFSYYLFTFHKPKTPPTSLFSVTLNSRVHTPLPFN